jgi:glyoxylate reductase
VQALNEVRALHFVGTAYTYLYMSMKSVFVTRRIPEAGIVRLREAGVDVVVSEKDGVLTHEELVAALRKRPYDAVISLLTDKISVDVLDAVPTAKIFANCAVGFDNIDVNAAHARGVVVTNTPGVLTEAVAEHTIALMLAVARRIPEADRFTRAGKYTGWAPEMLLGMELKGKTLGLVGAGRIGYEVARMATAFGMRIVYSDVSRNTALEETYGATYATDADDVLRQADVVSLHVPLLPTTQHLMNAERLALMKPTAYLINTSRGPIVDEVALVDALRKGAIRGAALDVFESEPALAAGLIELDNVVITPHIASATTEARDAMSMLAAENVLAVFDEHIPPNIVKSAT